MKFIQNKVVDIAVNYDCIICPMAKQTSLVFPRSIISSSIPLHPYIWMFGAHIDYLLTIGIISFSPMLMIVQDTLEYICFKYKVMLLLF